MAMQRARAAGEVAREVVDKVEETGVAVKDAVLKAAPPRAAAGAPAAPPVIPTSWLEPREQYLAAMAVVGLIETMKLWDIVSTWLPFDIEPTWSAPYRVQSFGTATWWFVAEFTIFAGLALLRIPRLSPTFLGLAGMLILWNAACYAVAAPGQILGLVPVGGPASLGVPWFRSIFKLLYDPTAADKGHITGVHRVRLLPFSTATLNPLSLTYCIPQGPQGPSTVYIPVVFNNSAPHEVSYFVRALDTGKAEVLSVGGASMKRSSSRPLEITDSEDDDFDTPDPLSALIHSSEHDEIDYSKLPSIKPADSLAIVPTRLSSTEQMLFLAIDRPSVISLRSVTDKRGDKFHLAPHRETVIIECPTGGDFVNVEEDKVAKTPVKTQQRCVGQEDTMQIQVRGVGAMKAAWRKRSKRAVTTGVIEGIEPVPPTTQADDTGALVLSRLDRVAQTHTVPLRIEHDAPGVYSISVTGVSDSMHNSYVPEGREYAFDVHARPAVRFDCPRAIKILENRTAELNFKVESLDGPGQMGDVQLSYEYELADGSIGGDTVKVHGNKGAITAKQAGVYKLVDVSATCSGQIQEPASCRVELIPVPTVELGVNTVRECAMDVGVTVSFDFTGQPPFSVEYTEQRNGGKTTTRRHRVETKHGDIVLMPEYEGTWTYNFVSLTDRNYNNLPLSREPIVQTIHPLATVDLVGQKRRERLWACGGDSISLNVDAKGRGPLKLNYLITSQSYTSGKTRSENVTIDIPSGRSSFTVPVPPELAAKTGNKGKFSAALLAVTDGNGCTRRLTPAPSYEVDVDRERPTARLAKPEKVVLVEGQQTKAYLRLTGTAPWTVYYTVNGGREKSVTMRDANNALSLGQEGVYRLTKIKDDHCEGDVIDPSAAFEIAFKPRPLVNIVPSKAFTLQNGVYQHRGLCQEQEDQVAFQLQGQGPFELVYRHTRNGATSRHTLKSAQDTGVLHLATEPGSHRYDVLEISDANYGSQTLQTPIAVSHEINSRPSVSFGRQNTRKLCLDSGLSSDAKIYFEGKAPFDVQLSVRRPASLRVDTYDINVGKSEWTLDIPQHILKDIGRHEITITKMSDSTGCEWIVHDLDRLSTTIEVVESARIVPVSQVKDLCVGDTLGFELQGTAPWSVEYTWLGKSHRVTSSASQFLRSAERAGDFEITSVALKDDQCKRSVTGLARRVHPLPSVSIQDGTDDLREGDDPAVFAVHFKGTAPFSFTYTRSEVVGGKNKVLDTQTVSDIWEDSYTISSSLPGDYQVISVSDKYCRFPRIKDRKG